MGKKKHWHRHRPPWWDEESWQDREQGSSTPPRDERRSIGEEWPGSDQAWWHEDHWKEWRHGPPFSHRRRARWAKWEGQHGDKFLFARFAIAFGLFVLLGCAALVAFAGGILFFLRQGASADPHPLRLILLLVGAFFLFAIAFRFVGRFTARRLTQPLSETMKAADALAAGDLSARVPLEGSGEFRHFARSFNRMAEALETADRQRRELLADIAHELRTPLTVIQGNLEGVRDGVYGATPEQLDLVLDETQKLGHLVDDLRLLTLAEAGQLPLDLQILDVSQLLADVRDAFACQAREAGIALNAEIPGTPPPLRADPQRMGQILGNLVTNALRHTPPGGEVTLGTEVHPGGGGIRFWVSDTGEGIAAEDVPRIFDRFWRADPARSHESGAGSGLGLAIAKSLVEAQGGRIWAESEVGRGTTVSCIFQATTAVP
jgi:two-component system OmpR family sensor kinase/two-component system sensor histidine kinase BaeS